MAPGKSGNPTGYNGRNSRGEKALKKIQAALDNAIDGLGKAVLNQTASELSVLITEALRKDVVGTLKGLQFCLPKTITVDHRKSTDVDQMSDDELAMLISSRAQARYAQERTIDAEVIDTDDNQADDVNVPVHQEGVSD